MEIKKVSISFCCLIILSSSILFNACSNPTKPKKDYFPNIKSVLSFPQLSIKFDTLPLAFNFSGEGIFEILNDTLVIVDEMYKIIHFYNINEKIFSSSYEFINKIQRSTDFNQSTVFTKYSKGFVLMNGRKLSFFDTKMQLDTTIYLKFAKAGILDPLDHPDPLSMDIYEINYRKRKKAVLNDLVLVSLESEHPNFNPYTSLAYYVTGEAFGIVDINKKRVIPATIKKSSEYTDTCCFPVVDWASIAIDKNKKEILVQFPIDSAIYVYDLKFQKKYKYGMANNHFQKRVVSNSLNIAFDKDLFDNQVSMSAVFESIFLLSDKRLVVRNFIDYSTKKQYLQVYKGKDLAFDQEIPFDYELIGNNRFSLFVRSPKSNIICKIDFF